MPALLEELALFIEPFFERELIVELGEPIKSGKEATVFRCHAHPRTGHSQLALKVYRPRTLDNHSSQRVAQRLNARWLGWAWEVADPTASGGSNLHPLRRARGRGGT